MIEIGSICLVADHIKLPFITNYYSSLGTRASCPTYISTEKDWIAGQAYIYPLLIQGYSNNRVYNYYTIKDR
jgi:hypothetical protein